MIDKVQGNRPLIMAPVMAIIMAFFFAFCLYPVANSIPKDIPVAVVSLDEGAVTPNGPVNAGDTMVSNLLGIAKTNDALNLKTLQGEGAAMKALKDGDYCALLVIPADFSAKQLSIATAKPSSPELKIYINQGRYGQTTVLVQQALAKMTQNAGNQMKPQILAALRGTGVNITGEQAAIYDEPITASIDYVHPVGGRETSITGGNADALGGMMTWPVALISSVILYRYYRKEKTHDVSFSAKRITVQIAGGLITAITGALAITFSMTKILGLEIPFGETSLFGTIAIFGLMMIIVSVLRWMGLGGIALFIVTLFLGISTAILPYEVLPEFWQNWIYPWAPARLVSSGLREVFYISGHWFNDSTGAFLMLAIVGISLLYLTVVNKKKVS